MSGDEEDRRRTEINMFAAMANGDFSSGTFDSNSLGKTVKEDHQEEAAPSSPEPDSMQNIFAQAVSQVDNSGTFNVTSFDKNKQSGDVGRRSNLEAAAAALADDGNRSPTQPVNAATMVLPRSLGVTTTPKKLKARTPMHLQQVYLPRPLFFGASIPPRVVEECRSIVAQAVENDKGGKMTQLPPDIRNLVSVIRTYGNGISILPGEEDTKPSPYVSVFCPKWSEESKVVEPPKATSADDNSPPSAGREGSGTNMTESTDSVTTAAESTQERPEPITAAGQSTAPDEKAAVAVDTNISARDLFSMWARGEDDAGPVDSSSGSPYNKNKSSSSDKAKLERDNNMGSFTRGRAESADNRDRPHPAPDQAKLERDNSMGSFTRGRAESVDNRDRPHPAPGLAKLERDNSMGSLDNRDRPQPVPMSDQDLFSQWARGESPANASSDGLRKSFGGSAVFNDSGGSATFFNNSGTFMNVGGQDEDSDDDSLVGSELKKKVGVNEHLNAALASLEEEWYPSANGEGPVSGVLEDGHELTQMPLTPDGGRSLNNHELMNGCSPLFGVDDSPLPVEADLGIHETRDEQQRSKEQRRNQVIIENCCPQNVFGPLACPNPALNPDDNYSWNSRSTPSQRSPGIPTTVGAAGDRLGVLPSPKTPATRTPKKSPLTDVGGSSSEKVLTSPNSKSSSQKSAFPFQHRTFDSRSRFGWWNVPNEEEDLDTSMIGGNSGDSTDASFDIEDKKEAPLQLPPWEHSALTVLVQTQLEPKPEKLQEQNRPLSHLHPATSLAQALPFLSDRPPSYRYLQIDTQAVGFPALGGEIEPLFCTLAIYHVETLPHSNTDPGTAPIPDLQRCGKITETLNFDVVSDPSIEKRCSGSLWPYDAKKGSLWPHAAKKLVEKLQGTRCGVFPLPSNLNMHNLYAILTVNKVISEGSDFEVYLRPGKSANATKNKEDKVDIELLRARAEKASSQQGKFIMPFAFGVAPLLQVFGADVPVVPSSRAVQIPLFRFSSGHGERQIIDHIMVMLYPR
jgi:hypothetical protein